MKKNKLRFITVIFFLSAAVLLLLVRLVEYMVILHKDANSEPLNLPEIIRGPILDRNGENLAITIMLDSVAVWTDQMGENSEHTVKQLAEILGMHELVILEKLIEKKGFVWIKRKIADEESEAIKKLKTAGELAGVSLYPEYGRIYPKGSLACHVIGYVGTDNTGLEGIEYSLSSELAPQDSKASQGKIRGNQVFLTIDINIQYLIEKIAQETMEKNQAQSVMVLVMETKTGNILSYVSLPGFDPNNFADYSESQRLNGPIRVAYEPGSVFKMFSLATLLQNGAISLEDTFHCNGHYEDPSHNITINCLTVHGNVNLNFILKYSCNAGAAYASDRIDAVNFYQTLRDFGFGEKTGIEFSGETRGIFKNPSEWSSRSKPTIAFGQEISVSALQMIAAANVLANKGSFVLPHIVSRIVGPDGRVIRTAGREIVRQVISPATAKIMLENLKDSTPSLALLDGISVSAKTGTAQVADATTKTYSQDKFIASILCLLPSSNPELIIYIVIEYPKGIIYGSKIAAPVFEQIADTILPLLGLQNSDSATIIHSGEITVPQTDTIFIGDTMPDLMGKPKRLLLPLLSRQDLKVELRGYGYVVKQYPKPGTPLREGSKIILEFQ